MTSSTTGSGSSSGSISRFIISCRSAILALLLLSLYASAALHPTLTIAPEGSFILLNGTGMDGTKHVLHSLPCYGAEAKLAFPQVLLGWTPEFSIASREVRFSGANGESINYSTAYYNEYDLGIARALLANWMVGANIGYKNEIFLRAPSNSSLWIEKVNTPTASVKTDLGLYRYKGFTFDVHLRVLSYFPVSTPDYSAKIGYGVAPSVSTTHVFSKNLSGTAEGFYLKRVQNTTAFALTEQDFGVKLAFVLSL